MQLTPADIARLPQDWNGEERKNRSESKMSKLKEYKVMCANMIATYSAGRYCAESAEQAREMAADAYRKSNLGRMLGDVGAFRFWTVDKFPHERDEE